MMGSGSAMERSRLAALAALDGIALIKEIERQSRPRRWPWQPKTVRDLINERRTELVELAAEQSAALAAAAMSYKNRLLGEPEPEPKARRMLRLVGRATERSAALASLASARRAKLLAEAKRQSQPRRWPWQQKTLRDRFDERRSLIKDTASSQVEQVTAQAVQTAERTKVALAGVVPTVQTTASVAATRAKDSASVASERVQQAIAAVPHTVDAKASAAKSALTGTAGSVSKRVGEKTDAATASVRAAAQVPVVAAKSGVAAGRRRVRRGVRLLRAVMWAAALGVAVGLLLAPRSGKELRQQLRSILQGLLDSTLPSGR